MWPMCIQNNFYFSCQVKMTYQEDVPFLSWGLWAVWPVTDQHTFHEAALHVLFTSVSSPTLTLQSDSHLHCSHGLVLTKITCVSPGTCKAFYAADCSFLGATLLCHMILLWFLSGDTQPLLFSTLSMSDPIQSLIFKCHSYHTRGMIHCGMI